MMFKWSDLSRLPEYLFIGLKRGMPWAPWSWTISDRLEHEVASLDKTSNKLSLKHEINQKHEDIVKSENTKM